MSPPGARQIIVLAVFGLAALAGMDGLTILCRAILSLSCNVSASISGRSAGAAFKLLLGIDVATIVPVKRQLKQEFGFATRATDPYQASRDGKRETQMVTVDLNAALVEWVIQYRITDPSIPL